MKENVMGTESHGPTEEAVEAALDALYPAGWRGRGERAAREDIETALRGALPLLRTQLCQELAEAIRERWGRSDHAVAEFVESFALEGSVPAEEDQARWGVTVKRGDELVWSGGYNEKELAHALRWFADTQIGPVPADQEPEEACATCGGAGEEAVPVGPCDEFGNYHVEYEPCRDCSLPEREDETR